MKNSLNFNQSDLVDLSTPARELVSYSLEFDNYYLEDYDLASLVEDIKVSRMSFVRTGLIFFKVKYLKLYKSQYSRFNDFCEECCNVSGWQVNRLIEASRVVYDLIAAGFTEVLPTCEAQCRVLSRLPISDLLEVWNIVTDTLEAFEITACKIEKIMREYLGMPPKAEFIKIKGKLLEHIKSEAFEAGLSVEEYMKEVTSQKIEEKEDTKEIEIERWFNDLRDLNNREESLVSLLFKVLSLRVFSLG